MVAAAMAPAVVSDGRSGAPRRLRHSGMGPLGGCLTFGFTGSGRPLARVFGGTYSDGRRSLCTYPYSLVLPRAMCVGARGRMYRVRVCRVGVMRSYGEDGKACLHSLGIGALAASWRNGGVGASVRARGGKGARKGARERIFTGEQGIGDSRAPGRARERIILPTLRERECSRGGMGHERRVAHAPAVPCAQPLTDRFDHRFEIYIVHAEGPLPHACT